MAALKKHPSVCLNMIVKNESKVIVRCLASLKHVIDYWVIVDTGSTDGTQDIIKNFMKDVPGEIFDRPWVDFGHNRTEALQLAKGKADYLFIIDADEFVVLENNFSWKDLYLDSYLVEFQDHGMSYVRAQIVNNHLNWYYKGVLHEYIESKEAKNQGKYQGIKITRLLDGARSSDPHKFKKDALILEKAILDEPDNDRYVFYLAQSYRDAGDIEQAIRYYKKRIAMKGWDQEVWYSMYQIAQLMEKRGDNWNEVLQAYLQAFEYRPNRVGPLFRIMRYYMYNGPQYHIAHIFGQKAMGIPIPNEALFIESSIYQTLLPLEFGVCSYYVGDDEASIRSNNMILKRDDVPGDLYVRVLANRKFSLDRIYSKKDKADEHNYPIKIIILFQNPGHYLDNCIERLLNQDYESYEMVFVDNGSTDGSLEKVPEGHPQITKLRKDPALSEGACLHQVLTEYVEDDELCFIIRGDDWLENNQVLTNINQHFQHHDCDLLYGQFRFSDGRLGYSLPLASINDLKTESLLPIASIFKYTTYLKLLEQFAKVQFMKDMQGSWLENGKAHHALIINLIRAIGMEKTHFSDSVMLNYNIDRLSDSVFYGMEKWTRKSTPRSKPKPVYL